MASRGRRGSVYSAVRDNRYRRRAVGAARISYGQYLTSERKKDFIENTFDEIKVACMLRQGARAGPRRPPRALRP
ncbi:hypothetical protein EVAR_42695_1 [Eumeta japonica]|uniref:Uncharacterized protein n=1 Tax=Eumeta variegata TaxID=151549 RepID=A0A4C1X0M9_EUMVA|nr:hypothetical protein EVAR_42695_1 [Eumeta japonica]